MFGLYAAGIVGALTVSFVVKRLFWRATPGEPFMLELPDYKMPRAKSLAIGLWTRAIAFLKRAGTTILSMMILIWLLASFPQPPEGATEPAINYSLAAMIGHGDPAAHRAARLQLADQRGADPRHGGARGRGRRARHHLRDRRRRGRGREDRPGDRRPMGLATALALLAWYVFAPQCASTLAVIRRETGGWKWMWITFVYMLALAYVAALATYQIARALGAG